MLRYFVTTSNSLSTEVSLLLCFLEIPTNSLFLTFLARYQFHWITSWDFRFPESQGISLKRDQTSGREKRIWLFVPVRALSIPSWLGNGHESNATSSASNKEREEKSTVPKESILSKRRTDMRRARTLTGQTDWELREKSFIQERGYYPESKSEPGKVSKQWDEPKHKLWIAWDITSLSFEVESKKVRIPEERKKVR